MKKVKMKKYFILIGLATLFAVTLIAMYSFTTPTATVPAIAVVGQNIEVEGCFTKNIGKPSEEFIGCNHNTLFHSGMNMTRDKLLAEASTKILNLTLCNATTNACEIPTAEGTEAFSLLIDSGLAEAQGTASILDGHGNVSIQYTWTASATKSTNVTRLGNGTDYFAGISFTTVSLTASDTLTANLTLYAAES